MKKIRHTIKDFIKTRKILSIVILFALIGVGYVAYGKFFPTATVSSYVVSTAKIGTIVSTVTGTGQISAANQIDVKSKVSGDIVYLNTKDNGQPIKKGTLIAQIDTRDAQMTLESARISYAKLTSTEAPNTLQAYDDGFNAVTSTFLHLPSIMEGLDTLFYTTTGYLNSEKVRLASQVASDYQLKAGMSFDKAKANYTNLLITYRNISRKSSTSTLESFITDTYLLAKDVSEAVKNTQNTIDYVRQQKNDGTGATEASNVSSWSNTINSDLASLLSARTSIQSSAQAIIQNDLSIAAQRLDLQGKENTYQDYFIRAPFDAVLARLSVKSTDSVSSGTVIGTLISSQKISTITLNEVDVGKVHVGQKTKFTFDAIDGLTIDGTVISVDLVGTVTQGVVNYNVVIGLDTEDERIKSGMSVTATIITDTKENILVVPNSAIKSQGNSSYIETFTTPLTVTRGTTGTASAVAPLQKKVITGVSNDILTEIVSGIDEGTQVVTRTITSTTKTTTTPSILGTGTRIGGTGTGARTTTGFPRN